MFTRKVLPSESRFMYQHFLTFDRIFYLIWRVKGWEHVVYTHIFGPGITLLLFYYLQPIEFALKLGLLTVNQLTG